VAVDRVNHVAAAAASRKIVGGVAVR
jgi:hypothetical protein